jgi:glycosyltransferase involved in cell wall biosynthesis
MIARVSDPPTATGASTAPSLSIVIPVYNEPRWIGRTVADAAEAVRRAPLGEVEMVVVDDGSDAPTREALEALRTPFPLRVISQGNQGRFAARRVGIEATAGELVLLIDSRVSLAPDALRFVAERMADDPAAVVWNGHVDIDLAGNPYARFWNVLTEIVFREYFARPRTTSFGLAEFDRFPKGTGCFLAPREELLRAIAEFRPLYADMHRVSDDTHMIRGIAGRRRINISPGFACVYRARGDLRGFLRHAHHRGSTFVDGFLRPGTRFFWPLVAFYPACALALAAAARRPRRALAAAAAAPALAAAGALAARRGPADVAAVGALGPAWAVSYVAGLWRGLGSAIAGRLR